MFTQILSRKYGVFPYTPCPHTCTASSTINIQHQSGTFVTGDEPALARTYHPQSMVSIRAHLGVVYFTDFDKSIVTCIRHCNTIQNSFNVLTIFCAIPIHPFLLIKPWETLILFLMSPSFCLFQNVV